MGLLEKIKGMLGGNAEKVQAGLEKAGDMVDDKTGGKFTDKIDMVEDKIADVLEDDGDAEAEAEA